ncbi:MAG: spore coat protein U domain-containing protein [Gemmatimonadota bacterium]
MTDHHPSRRFRVRSLVSRAVAAGIVAGPALLPAVPAFGASSAAVSVSAVILPKSNCRFSTKAATLAFGNLDPGAAVAPADVTVSAPLVFRCNGGPPTTMFLVTDDDGQNETVPGGNRMRHATLPGTFLPYAFSVAPGSGSIPRNTPQTVTVTGTVRGADYRDAVPGDYADAVVVAIDP